MEHLCTNTHILKHAQMCSLPHVVQVNSMCFLLFVLYCGKKEQMTGVRMCSENYRKVVIAVCHAHLVQLLTQSEVWAAASTAAHSLRRHFRKHNVQLL